MGDAIIYISIQLGFAGIVVWIVKSWVGSIMDSIKELKNQFHAHAVKQVQSDTESKMAIEALKKDVQRLDIAERKYWSQIPRPRET